MIEYVIKAPTVDKSEKNIIPENLFQPPFRILVVAPSNSGKSVLISNLISSHDLPYRKLFRKNIFIWSSTFNLDDPSFSMSDNIEKDNVYDSYSESSIMDLVNEQTGIIKDIGKKKAPHLLFIFDDVVTDIPKSKASIINRLFFSARHLNVSIVLISQQYKMINRPIRLNASDLIVFETGNQSENKILASEQAIDENLFKEIYKDATKEPYSFLCVRNKLPLKKRYQKRLSSQIYKISD